MIAGNSTFFYKKERDVDHVCPHTIIYDIDVPYANYDYRFLLKNYYASEGATIDFGDDVISSNLKTDLANEPRTATIYTHRYLSAGTYRVTFDINDISALKGPRTYDNVHWSMFSLYCPSAGTTFEINSAWFSDYNESNHLLNLPNADRMQETVKIIDFNVSELQTALFYWPIFAGMNDIRVTNRQLQRLEASELKLNLNSLTCPVRHLKMIEGLNNYNQNNYALENKTAFGNANCKFNQLRKFTGNGFNYNLFLNADLADSLSAYTIGKKYQNSYPVGDHININFTGSDIKDANISVDATKSNSDSNIMLMQGAFKNCSFLSSVVLDPKIDRLNDETFLNCYSLTDIDCANVKVLNDSAFRNCIKLKRIELPNFYNGRTGSQFRGCVSLTGAYITGSISNTSVNDTDSMFYGCSSLVDFPTSSVIFGNKTIGISMFEGCTSLHNIAIPDHVETFKAYAFKDSGIRSITFPSAFTGFDKNNDTAIFKGCKSLTSVIFNGNVPEITEQAFYTCTALKEIEIPSSTHSIYDSAFHGCSRLSSITLNEGLTTLGDNVFNNTAITELTLPSSFTTLGGNCFNNCNSLNSLTFNSIVLLNSSSLTFGSSNRQRTVTVPWNEGEMNGWPWGAPSATTTFIYTGALSLAGPEEDEKPEDEYLKFYLPLTSVVFTDEIAGYTPKWIAGSSGACSATIFNEHPCIDAPATFGVVYKNLENTIDLSGDLSISMWFSPKVNAGSTWWTYCRWGEKTTGKALNIGGRYQNWIYAGNEGIDIGQKYGDTTQIPQAQQIGQWFHQVVRYSRSTQKISVYRNNVLIGEQSVNLQLTMNDTSDQHLKIGFTNRQCDTRYIHGFRIYQKCLTHENVAWLYNHKC